MSAVPAVPARKERKLSSEGTEEDRCSSEEALGEAEGAKPVQVTKVPAKKQSEKRVRPLVEEQFGFAEIQVVSFADLYAGKLAAALDRQHPRDLFDVQYLLANEGIDKALFQTFLAYILSHNRPAHEVLQPRLKDIRQTFEQEFVGMTSEETSLTVLLETRDQLISEIRFSLDEPSKRFMLSFHALKHDWELSGLPHMRNLPAIRWKLMNLERLQAEQPEKYPAIIKSLEVMLSGE